MTKLQKLLIELRDAIEAREAADAALTGAGEDANVEELERALDAALTSENEARSAYDAQKTIVEQREAALTEARNAVLPPVATPIPEKRDHVPSSGSKGDYIYAPGSGHVFADDVLAAARGAGKEAAAAYDRLERSNAELRDHGITVGSPGANFVVPPTRLPGEIVEYRRFPSALADAVGSKPLDDSVNAISIPTVTTGLTASEQTENNAFATGNIAGGEVTAEVKTYGVYYDVSKRAVRRTQPHVQDVLMDEAHRAVNDKVGTHMYYGSGVGDQILGLANVAGKLTATYTDATPTAVELVDVLEAAEGVQVETNKREVEAYAVTPRLWSWLKRMRDSQGNRVVNVYGRNANAIGGGDGPVQAGGFSGDIGGIPVLVDGHIVKNLGAGNNQTEIYLVTLSDYRLWESPDYVDIGTAAVVHMGKERFVVSRDVLWLPNLRPAGTTQVSGTGLIIA